MPLLAHFADLLRGHAPRSSSHLFRDPVTVLAHRGWSGRAPENTLAAFRLAAGAGFGFELDVGLTADGHAVVLHDDTLDRTTDGHGPLDHASLAEVRRLDAGSWFSPAFRGERVPLFTEVLDEFGGVVPIDVEIKAPRRGGPWSAEQLAAAVVAPIVARGLSRALFVTSFDPAVLDAVRRRCPELLRGQLWYRPARDDVWARLEQRLVGGLLFRGASPDLLGPDKQLWQEGVASRRRAQGYRLAAWTVNDPLEMQRLVALGVSVLITDHPDRAAGIRYPA